MIHTHGHTDPQSQLMTIPEGQNWPRVKIAWSFITETEISSDLAADNDASFNLSCPTHYHISHEIVDYKLQKYAYHKGYVDFFTNFIIKDF